MGETDGKTETLTDTLEGVSEWVIFLGPDGIVEWSNRAFNEFMGARESGDTPGDIRMLFPADANEMMEVIRDVMESGELRSGIIRSVKGMSGERKMIRFTALPRRDKDRGISGIFLSGLDITDTIEMEQLKKYAYTQIEKNIEQFAVLGDHLRNPLTAIIGLCELLDDRTTAAKIQARAMEIDALITRIDQGWIDSEKVRNIIKKYYDIGAAGTHELVARAIHDEYIVQQKKAGATPESNPSMRSWDELPHRIKDSNLRQVEDIWKILHKIDCTIGLSVSGREPLFTFTESEVEFLAEKEHERWVEERVRKGWAYGKDRDDQQKIHGCIVPWEQLSETQRQKDQNAVRALPAILAKVYLKIIRLDESNNNNLTTHNKNR
ncbi:RyR domain-containing protein [Methanoregula sp.]|uniref:RyR domain-containing protein n=1 Tax=Methanoregula sp. TaxID=2052170 RepID=UPI003C769155